MRDGSLIRANTVRDLTEVPPQAPARLPLPVARPAAPAAAQQLAALLKGHDAIISSAPFLPGSSSRLLDAIHQSGVIRYIAVGGAGSLEIAPGKLLKDSGQIPAEWLPAINEGAALLKLLRADTQLDWTFFSPAAVIGPGARTGQFRLGRDQLITGKEGKSAISYDDYAIALVDELEKPQHIRTRFTIGY